MKRFNFLMMLCIGILALSSCREIFEKDIEDKVITIYTPNGKDVINYTQTFWWEQVDFATGYQLQVVSPNFEAPDKMILDTIVKNNRFPYYIGPGEFEWRVRAMNGAYKTKYFGSKFVINISDLNLNDVFLKSPSNNSIISGKSVDLTWDKLPGATKYKIQICLNSGFLKNDLLKEDLLVNSYYPYSLNKDTIYYWRVKAINDKDSTDWSPSSMFTIDNKPPKVTLTFPLNAATDQVSPITLKWSDVGIGNSYNVYVKVGESGTFTLLNNVSGTNTSYTGTSGQTIYWKVKAKNSDGVEGKDGDTWSFKIK